MYQQKIKEEERMNDTKSLNGNGCSSFEQIAVFFVYIKIEIITNNACII